MGESVNLTLVLIVLAALFAIAPKLAMSGQIVVASLSTMFIAVVIAIWETSHFLSAEQIRICRRMQNHFVPSLSPFLISAGYCGGINYE